ncbi:potassium voltage-gated channel protein Shaw-like, partial [Ruditapes philippinarum]|uniref:potassium voltage-gated channel protein Shaw-like n=1 Tax=Ruditapes philippinarum TaxID=129788 RepID=UPI00295B55B7
MAGRVRIEVGGQVFTIPVELLENGPSSRLQNLYKSTSASNKTCVIAVERPHEMFPAILAMYQTGELHIPMTSCPGAFMNELAFWEIPVESLSSCYDWIDMLEYSQMLRALRLFRIVSSIRAGKVLAYSIRANLKDLSILCLFLIAGMCAFASCFYIAEDKKNVSSILIGWYWAVVTMTTVGYGDISPQSQ